MKDRKQKDIAREGTPNGAREGAGEGIHMNEGKPMEQENSRGVIVVRPDDAFRAYGEANPPFGTVLIDELRIEFVCDAKKGSPVNEDGYPIYPKLVGYADHAAREMIERQRLIFEYGKLCVRKARPTVTVTGGTATYDGNQHKATATATGVNGEDISSSGSFAFTYSTSSGSRPVNAGTYRVKATFTPDAGSNYETVAGSGSIVIEPAEPNVVVICETFTYDAVPHPASAKAIGINAEDISSSGSFAYTYTPMSTSQGGMTALGSATAQSPANAATYMVSATFTPGPNSNYSANTGTGFLTITPAQPTLTLNGGLALHDDKPHPASLSVTVAGKDVSQSGAVTCTYATIPGGTPVQVPTNHGAYAAMGYFDSKSENYRSGSATGLVLIQKNAPAFGGSRAVSEFTKAINEADTLLTGSGPESKEAALQALYHVTHTASHLIREMEERRGTLGRSEPGQRYEVTGQLVNSYSSPLVDFPVEIMNVHTQQGETTITNENGCYEFRVRDGSYIVSARGQQIGTVDFP